MRLASSGLTSNGTGGLGYNVYTVPEGQALIGTNGKLNPNATLGRKIIYNGQEYWLTPTTGSTRLTSRRSVRNTT